jgi:chemotaxis protein CheY-P-specific phosphatase CheC
MSEQDAGGRLTIPIEKVAIMNWLGQVGVDGVESRLRQLPVEELTVDAEQARSGYASEQSVDAQFEASRRIGVKVRIPDTPAGHMLVLFSPASANRAAAMMLQGAVDDVAEASLEMAQDALSELSNMIASGFVDEWADLFDRHIVTSAPTFVTNDERELVRRVVARDESLGLYISTRLQLNEYDVETTVLLFPEEETFVNATSKLSLSVIGA